MLHPEPPPRVTSYDRPWTHKADSEGNEVLDGAEIPLSDDKRLQVVPFSDKVRAHFAHGGTLDSLVMPDGDIERFVVQTDPTKDVVRSVTLPKGARIIRAAPQPPGDDSDGHRSGAGGDPGAPTPRPPAAAGGPRGRRSGAGGRAGRRDGGGSGENAPAATALTDTRSQRVLMLYELQSTLRSVEPRVQLTGAAAKLARRLARRMEEVREGRDAGMAHGRGMGGEGCWPGGWPGAWKRGCTLLVCAT